MSLPEVSVWEHLTGTQWGKVAQVGTYSGLTFAPTYQDVGTWSLTVPFDGGAELLPARLTSIDWRGTHTDWLTEGYNPAQGDDGMTSLTVSGSSAERMLGWCVMLSDPTAALSAQPVYDETKAAPIKGAAETVLINLVKAHFVTRYGAQIVVPATQGRGKTVAVRPKVGDNLLETMLTAAKDGGIGFDIALVSTSDTKATLTFRIVVPQDKTRTVRLKSSLGTVAAWEQADTAPSATRALVGSGDTKKRYSWITTPTSIAAATFWGGTRETYVDGPTSTDSDEITASGRASLADSAEGRALSITPAEAEGMQAFIHYGVSDIASAEIVTGATATAPITSIEVTVDENGATAKPTFGNPGSINSSLGIGQLLQGLRRAIRRIERN